MGRIKKLVLFRGTDNPFPKKWKKDTPDWLPVVASNRVRLAREGHKVEFPEDAPVVWEAPANSVPRPQENARGSPKKSLGGKNINKNKTCGKREKVRKRTKNEKRKLATGAARWRCWFNPGKPLAVSHP